MEKWIQYNWERSYFAIRVMYLSTECGGLKYFQNRRETDEVDPSPKFLDYLHYILAVLVLCLVPIPSQTFLSPSRSDQFSSGYPVCSSLYLSPSSLLSFSVLSFALWVISSEIIDLWPWPFLSTQPLQRVPKHSGLATFCGQSINADPRDNDIRSH